MAAIINKPQQSLGLKILNLCINGLFLFHLSASILFAFGVVSRREVPIFFQDIYLFIFTTPYLFFFFLSDLGLFILLKFKQRYNILRGTDYWLAALLGVKYIFIILLIIFILFILWLFSGSSL